MSDETTVGVVFGFDDVLAPDSTTFLLEQHGEDPEQFWSETFRDRIADGYDPTTAYLSALLERVGPEEPLAELTIDELRATGAALDDHLYDGAGEVFADLQEIAAAYPPEISVECFVVSEGLAPILRGSSIADDCTAVYGSELATDDGGIVSEIKQPISFTDKTRCLFEINKGVGQEERAENPYAVNDNVERDQRAILFDDMVYVGDGITDGRVSRSSKNAVGGCSAYTTRTIVHTSSPSFRRWGHNSGSNSSASPGTPSRQGSDHSFDSQLRDCVPSAR